jgi:hypothetical protein
MNISNPRPRSPKNEAIVFNIVTYKADPTIKYLLDDAQRISPSEAFQMNRRQRNKVGFAYFHGKRDTQQVRGPRIFAIGFNATAQSFEAHTKDLSCCNALRSTTAC